MRIIVDHDLCEANAVCVDEAPDVFTIDAESRMVVLRDRPGEDLVAEVRKAVNRCPRGALSLQED